MGIPAIPFHIATDRVRDGSANGLASEMLLKRALEIGRLRLLGLAGTIHRAARVDEPPVAVEDIKMRGAQGPVSTRNLLRFVVQI